MPSVKAALPRRSMQSPLFSKEAVRGSEHLITDMLAKFLNILSGDAAGARPVDLSLGLRCLTADTSMNFVFQRPFKTLDANGFESELVKGVIAFLGVMMLWSRYFPVFVGRVSRGVAGLPGWLVDRLVKPFALVNSCLKVSAMCPVNLDQLAVRFMMVRTDIPRADHLLTKSSSLQRGNTYGVRYHSPTQPRERTVHAHG